MEPAVYKNADWLAAMELTQPSLSMALKTAVMLNVFDILAIHGKESDLSADDIIGYISTSNPKAASMLDRILALLSSYSILNCSLKTGTDGENLMRHYGLTPRSKYFIRDSNGFSLSGWLDSAMDVPLPSCHDLCAAIINGGYPFQKAHGGMDMYEYLRQHPQQGAAFFYAMSSHSHLIMEQLLDSYEGFKSVNKLVDLGGGPGACLNSITTKYPHLTGINFDEPLVIASAPRYERILHVAGNMFETVPSGDAILMKCVLHNWDDERCIRILNNCWQALPEHGKVIVIDFLLLETPAADKCDPGHRIGFMYDVMMMLLSFGGKERTAADLERLRRASKFRSMKVVLRVNEMGVIEFYK
eukprot:c25137_g1_i2 orf=155-1228(-)